jgi:hypothetical protein
MTYTITQINALVRLFLFHTRESFTIAEMREKARNEIIGFTQCEIQHEIEENELG